MHAFIYIFKNYHVYMFTYKWEVRSLLINEVFSDDHARIHKSEINDKTAVLYVFMSDK